LNVLAADKRPEFYVATGYRVSQSKSKSEKCSSELDRYLSSELGHDHYERPKLIRAVHLLLGFRTGVLDEHALAIVSNAGDMADHCFVAPRKPAAAKHRYK
jgi:hypothetical protein